MAGELGVAARQAIPLEILVTEADVRRIEDALRVKLPSDYRHLLLHFPVRFSAGTADEVLWDNADKLISRNQELKVERRSLGVVYQAIPDHYFFIGDDGAGWQFLIDLRTVPSIVHIMEFEDVDGISPSLTDNGETETVNDWLHRHLLDLKNDGIDINSGTRATGTTWGCLRDMTLLFIIVAAVIGVAGAIFAVVKEVVMRALFGQ